MDWNRNLEDNTVQVEAVHTAYGNREAEADTVIYDGNREGDSLNARSNRFLGDNEIAENRDIVD